MQRAERRRLRQRQPAGSAQLHACRAVRLRRQRERGLEAEVAEAQPAGHGLGHLQAQIQLAAEPRRRALQPAGEIRPAQAIVADGEILGPQIQAAEREARWCGAVGPGRLAGGGQLRLARGEAEADARTPARRDGLLAGLHAQELAVLAPGRELGPPQAGQQIGQRRRQPQVRHGFGIDGRGRRLRRCGERQHQGLLVNRQRKRDPCGQPFDGTRVVHVGQRELRLCYETGAEEAAQGCSRLRRRQGVGQRLGQLAAGVQAQGQRAGGRRRQPQCRP